MNRRWMMSGLGVLGVLGLSTYACAGPSATVRYRIIVTAEVDGQKVEASTVMESRYWRVSGPGPRGGDGKNYGEALILDLKNRGTVFVLPIARTDGSFSTVYGEHIFVYFGIRNGLGSLSDEDYEKLKKATGRKQFVGFYGRGQLPLFVAFKDEKDPRTVFEVDPKDLVATFGPGVRFIGMEIEFTNAPVTQVLMKRLPWLAKDQPGARGAFVPAPRPLVSTRDLPLPSRLSSHSFFESDSY